MNEEAILSRIKDRQNEIANLQSMLDLKKLKECLEKATARISLRVFIYNKPAFGSNESAGEMREFEIKKDWLVLPD